MPVTRPPRKLAISPRSRTPASTHRPTSRKAWRPVRARLPRRGSAEAAFDAPTMASVAAAESARMIDLQYVPVPNLPWSTRTGTVCCTDACAALRQAGDRRLASMRPDSVLKEEADNFAAGIGAARIGVRAVRAAPAPCVPDALQGPVLEHRSSACRRAGSCGRSRCRDQPWSGGLWQAWPGQ